MLPLAELLANNLCARNQIGITLLIANSDTLSCCEIGVLPPTAASLLQHSAGRGSDDPLPYLSLPFLKEYVSMKQFLLTSAAIGACLMLVATSVLAQPRPSDPDTAGRDPQRDQQSEARQSADEREGSQRQHQASQSQSSPQTDEEATEYRGNERAALGVMLSEGRDGQVSISQVLSGSPAEQAGIRRGDKIKKIDNQEVNAYRDVIRLVNRKGPDDDIRITIQRAGEEKQLDVSLEPREEVFNQDQLFSMPTQNPDRGQSAQRTSRQDQWRADSGGLYERPQQVRSRNDQRFGQQPSRRGPGQEGEYADNRRPQYDDRSYQSDRREQGSRAGYDQNSDQVARRDDRRADDRFYEQYDQRDARQREQYSQRQFTQRQSDRPTLGIGLRTDGPALRVSQVYRNSAAEDAGLRRGDEIVEMEGRQVRSYEQLLQALDQHEAGESITLVIVRDGRRRQVDAQLQRPDEYSQQSWQQQRARGEQGQWDDRQPGADNQEQRTGDRDWEAGRKQTGEPYDAEFDF